jgi:hypothetical protein
VQTLIKSAEKWMPGNVSNISSSLYYRKISVTANKMELIDKYSVFTLKLKNLIKLGEIAVAFCHVEFQFSYNFTRKKK